MVSNNNSSYPNFLLTNLNLKVIKIFSKLANKRLSHIRANMILTLNVPNVWSCQNDKA